MNEVREAIDRVGSRFDPPGDGWGDLSRRRRGARTRRRITVGALALAIAAGGSLLAVRAFPASTPETRSKLKVAATWPAAFAATPTAARATEPECPTPNGDSPPQVILSSASGTAGSSIEVSGTFQTHQLWLQLWWNADEDGIGRKVDPPPWPPTGPELQSGPAGPGPVVEVASVAGPAVTGDCSFQTQFTVPDVGPGTYQLLWVIGMVALPESSNAYAMFTSPIEFQVTG
jgi:hypothetical protein